MKLNIKFAQILDKHLPADGVGTEREKLRIALMDDLLTLDGNIIDRTEVACLCLKKVTFDYWVKDFGKSTENYTWVYNIDRVRGRRFDRIEKLYEYEKIRDIDDILDYLEPRLNGNWKRINNKTKDMGNLVNFGEAIEALKKGKKVARIGWNGKGMWLRLVETDYYSLLESKFQEEFKTGPEHNLLPWIGMKTADDKFVPWLASQTDVLAEDWIIIQEP